jgi:hypothetical protein
VLSTRGEHIRAEAAAPMAVPNKSLADYSETRRPFRIHICWQAAERKNTVPGPIWVRCTFPVIGSLHPGGTVSLPCPHPPGHFHTPNVAWASQARRSSCPVELLLESLSLLVAHGTG